MDYTVHAMAPRTGEEGEAGGGAAWTGFLPLILMIAIFWFLLIRPQQKKSKRHQEIVSGLKRGDEVVTNSGIHGRVIGLTDTIVTLEIADKVHVKFDRNQVSGIKGKGEEAKGQSGGGQAKR